MHESEALRARGGLAVELRATPGGPIEHRAQGDHRLSVHAGAPVRVTCAGSAGPTLRTRGEINLLPAGSSDAWVEDDPGVTLELGLPTSLVRQTAAELGLDPERTGIVPQFHFRDPHIEHIAWALEAESRAGFPNGRLYRESLGTALAVHLLGRYRAPAPARSRLSPRQLARVTGHVEDHLGRSLSLTELAEVAGLSPSHFKTLFKRATGVPVHEYVVRRRVERAKALLRDGRMPAAEVALEAGFAHQSHMARWMRRILGVTPTAVARFRF